MRRAASKQQARINVIELLVAWNALTNLNLNEWAKRADIVAEICIQRSISPLDRWKQA